MIRVPEKIAAPLAFAAGVLYDMATLTRIDSGLQMTAHGLLLLFLAAILQIQIQPKGIPERIWRYRHHAMAFANGSLLSAFLILYFRSTGSLINAVFIWAIAAALLLNEWRSIGASRTLRTLLFGFCTISYFVYAIPVLYGNIVPWTFDVALGISSVAIFFWHSLSPRFNWVGQPAIARIKDFLIDRYLLAALFPLAAIWLLNAMALIPPVPLSVTHLGVYYSAGRKGDTFVVETTNRFHHWWPQGEAVIAPLEGAPIYALVQTFAPDNFRQEIRIVWQKKLQDWQTIDSIPMMIAGGRDNGFRGITYKQFHSPGRWRLLVELPDGRELGREYFKIVDSHAHPALLREFIVD